MTIPMRRAFNQLVWTRIRVPNDDNAIQIRRGGFILRSSQGTSVIVHPFIWISSEAKGYQRSLYNIKVSEKEKEAIKPGKAVSVDIVKGTMRLENYDLVWLLESFLLMLV